MEVNLTIRGEEKFVDFIEEFTTLDIAQAKADLERQFLANESANKYVVSAENLREKM